jgi:hypothetical protein
MSWPWSQHGFSEYEMPRPSTPRFVTGRTDRSRMPMRFAAQSSRVRTDRQPRAPFRNDTDGLCSIHEPFCCRRNRLCNRMTLRAVLPAHHLNSDSKDAIKLATAVVATLAALALGLLVASAKTSFDTADTQLRNSTARTVLLDRVLAH